MVPLPTSTVQVGAELFHPWTVKLSVPLELPQLPTVLEPSTDWAVAVVPGWVRSMPARTPSRISSRSISATAARMVNTNLPAVGAVPISWVRIFSPTRALGLADASGTSGGTDPAGGLPADAAGPGAAPHLPRVDRLRASKRGPGAH